MNEDIKQMLKGLCWIAYLISIAGMVGGGLFFGLKLFDRIWDFRYSAVLSVSFIVFILTDTLLTFIKEKPKSILDKIDDLSKVG